jgi:excisionase family DNA binding protein
MDNPFEIIDARLARIEKLLLDLKSLAFENSPEPETVLLIRQVAELVKLSVPTIYGYVSRNEIPYSKKGKRLYFFKAEIIEWIKEGRRKTNSEIAAEANTYLKRKKVRYE